MLRPFITIDKRANQALKLYRSIFPSFTLKSVENHAAPNNDYIMLAVFSIMNQEIMISDSFVSHDWSITPGVSFFLNLEDIDEQYRIAELLSENGKVHMPINDYGFSKSFGWFEDQFGLNWQLNVE